MDIHREMEDGNLSRSIELEALSRVELKKLIKEATARKALIEKRAPIAAVRKQILGYAAKEGYSIHELFGVGSDVAVPARVARRGPSPMKGAKLPILYRHPDEKSLTWTGRGSQPRWLADLIASGGELKDYKLKQVYKAS